jgi:hypothetical protein
LQHQEWPASASAIQEDVLDERRNHDRLRVRMPATIAFGRRSAAVDCVVLDFSAGGACLELKIPLGIPDEFELTISHSNIIHPCLVVWRKPRRFGVAFEQTTQQGYCLS